MPNRGTATTQTPAPPTKGGRMARKKATAGERFVGKMEDHNVNLSDTGRREIAKSIDRLLARERRKVAEDVLAMADDVAQTKDELVAKVRAKGYCLFSPSVHIALPRHC